MRTLVLQLARFGDIYQTWPVLNALKREGHEVHVLVRQRFKAALEGIDVAVHALPTADVLAPVYQDGDENAALTNLEVFIEPLVAAKFDRIVNLSFSPFSSYLTDWLTHPHTQVSGYTRHADGFLAIPDDASAYFYAQVGVGGPNRYHLTDVFATVAQVELTAADFRPPSERKNRICLHVGASQAHKAYPPELWAAAAEKLRGSYAGEIVLIGSAEERKLAEAVCARVPGLDNRAGRTTLSELLELVATSRLLLGADSAPVHMAALTDTPVLNLSGATVNFYETGPARGRVLYANEVAEIDPADVAREAFAMLNDLPPQTKCFTRADRNSMFEGPAKNDFAWSLIQALYTGSPYPTAAPTDALAFRRLFEVAELALAQIPRLDGPGGAQAAAILESVDDMLKQIAQLAPGVAPVVRWFDTQRLRLPPASAEETCERTQKLFEELLWIAAVYRPERPFEDLRREAVELCLRLAPDLRECELGATDFQALVTTLQELSRHSTNVEGRSWSEILREAEQNLQSQDYIALADLLEHQLAPALRNQCETSGPEMIS